MVGSHKRLRQNRKRQRLPAHRLPRRGNQIRRQRLTIGKLVTGRSSPVHRSIQRRAHVRRLRFTLRQAHRVRRVARLNQAGQAPLLLRKLRSHLLHRSRVVDARPSARHTISTPATNPNPTPRASARGSSLLCPHQSQPPWSCLRSRC